MGHDTYLSRRAAGATSSVIRDLLAVTRQLGMLSLAGGLPDETTLPGPEIAELVGRVVGGDRSALQYGPTEGEPRLREWIADHELDGAEPDQVLVTHGAQQALALLADALVDPGDVVVVERASYVGALQPLRRAGARFVDVGSDRDGMRTDELEALLVAGARPKLLYVCPTFQNPTGSVMSAARRAHLGELAARHRVVVVDDDPYRALGFTAPPARLRDHVPAELAVTVGSFSKTVAPGLRVGWVHGPRWLTDALVTSKQAQDLHTGTLSQRLLVELLADPDWLAVRSAALVEIYRPRAVALTDGLTRRLGDRVRIDTPVGGMFAWADFPGCPLDTDELLRLALLEGVAFVPGSAFDHLSRPGVSARLCFSSLDESRLDEATDRLAVVVDRAWQDRSTQPR